ncbi:MAG: VanZ family protein [Nanoarchaeota archaeon]
MYIVRWFEKNRGISWLVTVIIAVLIFYISSLTFPAGGGTGYLSYIYHFTVFSYLALFLLISITKGKKSKSLLILGVVLAIIYGISDEIHQYFVPGRYSSFKDILINSIGVLIISIGYINYCNVKPE